MQPDKLEKHVFATYLSLRIGMAVLGIALPLVLWWGGLLKGVPLQESMSDYYHVVSDGKSMRDFLVGLLFAIGAFLYLYKGFTTLENWLLNFAGAFAILVALFPVQWNCGEACSKMTAHAVFAVSFFLCIAFVCFCCAKDTLEDRGLEEGRKKWYRFLYWATGAAMLLSPATAFILTQLFHQHGSYIFFIEASGVVFFSVYWLIKSWELRETKAERRALRMTV